MNILILGMPNVGKTSLYNLITNKNNNIIPLDKLTIWNKLYRKTVVIREVIVPGANLIDPIPKQVTNK